MNSAKKKSRRTVSINGPRYWAFRAECKAVGKPMAMVLGELILRWLREQDAPTTAPRPPSDELHNNGEPPTRANFTF